MNYEKLKGGLVAAFAGTGLIVSLGLGSGVIANAEGVDNDTAQTSSTDSTVLTEEQCTWFMIGAPTSITMSPGFESDGTTPLEYTGENLAISSDLSDINVYSSGNLGTGTATTNSECSFYTPEVAPIITYSINDANFAATYGSSVSDPGLDFVLSESLPLAIDLQEKTAGTSATTCDDMFSVTDVNLFGTTNLSAVGMTIPTVSDVTSPVATDQGDRCETTASISTTIPAITTQPAQPGVDYTWTGPTVQIVRSTSELDEASR